MLRARDACGRGVFFLYWEGVVVMLPSHVSLSIITTHMHTKEIPDARQGIFNCVAKAFQGPFSRWARPLCPSPGLPHPVPEVKLISCVEIRCHLLIHCIVFSCFLIHEKTGSGNMHPRHLRSDNSTFLIQKSRCGHSVMATVKQVNRVEDSAALSPVTRNLFGISTP